RVFTLRVPAPGRLADLRNGPRAVLSRVARVAVSRATRVAEVRRNGLGPRCFTTARRERIDRSRALRDAAWRVHAVCGLWSRIRTDARAHSLGQRLPGSEHRGFCAPGSARTRL